MKKVDATADVSAWVECPYCEHYFDVISYESEHYGDSEISDNLYDNTTEACTNMDVRVGCPECAVDFIVDMLEY